MSHRFRLTSEVAPTHIDVSIMTSASTPNKDRSNRPGGEADSFMAPSDLHPASYRPASLTVNTSPRNVSIIINPMEASSSSGVGVPSLDRYHPDAHVEGGGEAGSNRDSPSQAGTESPGTSQLSPPPSYHDIPGTVPVHQGISRGPPPSYEDAVDVHGDPPSYDSVFGRIRDTHKASRNFIDFLVKLLILLLGTIGCTIACSITVVIPMCMIVIGSVYLNECPAEPYIPVFLIVGGTFSVFKYLLGVITRVCQGENEREHRTTPAQSLISCFLCGWFITGCVWVYRIYKPLMDEIHQGDPHYCNRTVYIFAFWLITIAYIFLGFFTSCICCFSIGSIILKREI